MAVDQKGVIAEIPQMSREGIETAQRWKCFAQSLLNLLGIHAGGTFIVQPATQRQFARRPAAGNLEPLGMLGHP